ncbi:urease accessory protein UreF [Mycolicibacterium komossense]|uniref:Urease accessory protein UreF n=2 Tax=Mycolicibacterium komossense TaxID=1779 RepID=A0ABT3CES9_9MYCO|nr:urease accessory protein UreF [Mycolicibacterium komossense]
MRAMQFADSMLPVGAFSFSNGLETAVAEGFITDARSLGEFVEVSVRQAARCDGIALLHAHRGARAGDLDRVVAADHAVWERKINEEARTMTSRMGRKLAELTTRVVPDSTLIQCWLERLTSGQTPGTFPVGLAVVFAELGSPETDAFGVHQYGVASTLLGAALRIARVDHVQTQEILFAVNGTAEKDYDAICGLGIDDMTSFVPMMDIFASIHVRSHIRMFMN